MTGVYIVRLYRDLARARLTSRAGMGHAVELERRFASFREAMEFAESLGPWRIKGRAQWKTAGDEIASRCRDKRFDRITISKS